MRITTKSRSLAFRRRWTSKTTPLAINKCNQQHLANESSNLTSERQNQVEV